MGNPAGRAESKPRSLETSWRDRALVSITWLADCNLTEMNVVSSGGPGKADRRLAEQAPETGTKR